MEYLDGPFLFIKEFFLNKYLLTAVPVVILVAVMVGITKKVFSSTKTNNNKKRKNKRKN